MRVGEVSRRSWTPQSVAWCWAHPLSPRGRPPQAANRPRPMLRGPVCCTVLLLVFLTSVETRPRTHRRRADQADSNSFSEPACNGPADTSCTGGTTCTLYTSLGRRLFGAPAASSSAYYCLHPICTSDELNSFFQLMPTDLQGTNCQTFIPSQIGQENADWTTICACFLSLTSVQLTSQSECRPNAYSASSQSGIVAQCQAQSGSRL